MTRAATTPLLRLIDRVYPEAVAVRRTIHAEPELSGEEFRTARLAYSYLKKIGMKPRYFVNKTAVAVTFVNGKGKTVVLRADMDALPIEEKNRVAFASRSTGVMHACGHDMHTACLLAAMRVLLSTKDFWQGTVVALFQPSEEVAPGGALSLIKEKAFPDKTDAVFGLHVSVDHPAGYIGLKPGRDYAGVMDFNVTILGLGGHGATPHRAIDPLICSCAIIMELQTLVSRQSPANEPTVLTVGSLHAGTKHNIIADTASFCGTIRTFSKSHQLLLKRRTAEIVTLVARSFNAQATISFQQSYPPGYNDEGLTQRTSTVLRKLLGNDRVVFRDHPSMFAEDFAYYQKKAPGVYAYLGVASANRKNQPGLHTPNFLPEESALKTGIALHAAMAMDILRKEGRTKP